jgi:hypothetical protein
MRGLFILTYLVSGTRGLRHELLDGLDRVDLQLEVVDAQILGHVLLPTARVPICHKKSAEGYFTTTTAFLPDDSVVNVDTHRAMVGPHDVIADERAPDKWHCSR